MVDGIIGHFTEYIYTVFACLAAIDAHHCLAFACADTGWLQVRIGFFDCFQDPALKQLGIAGLTYY